MTGRNTTWGVFKAYAFFKLSTTKSLAKATVSMQAYHNPANPPATSAIKHYTMYVYQKNYVSCIADFAPVNPAISSTRSRSLVILGQGTRSITWIIDILLSVDCVMV